MQNWRSCVSCSIGSSATGKVNGPAKETDLECDRPCTDGMDADVAIDSPDRCGRPHPASCNEKKSPPGPRPVARGPGQVPDSAADDEPRRDFLLAAATSTGRSVFAASLI